MMTPGFFHPTTEAFSLPMIFPCPIRTYESEPNFIKKYKTELCKNWATGCCLYGPACTFAHGDRELRDKPGRSLIRMKKCKQFLKMGFCSSGEKCLFDHPPPLSVRKRLPIFQEIEKKGLFSYFLE